MYWNVHVSMKIERLAPFEIEHSNMSGYWNVRGYTARYCDRTNVLPNVIPIPQGQLLVFKINMLNRYNTKD